MKKPSVKDKALTRPKNSNYKITYAERCDLVEAKQKLKFLAQIAEEYADTVGKIIPRTRWSQEKWREYQDAMAFIRKHFKKGE